MKRNGTLVFLMLFLLLICSNASAQQSQQQTINRSFGLGAYFNESQAIFLIPLWVSGKMAIVPNFGFIHQAQKDPFPSSTLIDFGVMLRFYQKMARVAPYFAVGTKYQVANIENGGSGSTNSIDIMGCLAFGGEFFLHNQFSIGIEAALNVLFPDDNTLSAVVFTNTGFIAIVYF